MRAAIYVRLSRETDETTSPERQRAACEALCEARGWEVVAAEEDIDVSGFSRGLDRQRTAKPGGVKAEPTGETHAEQWKRSDVAGKRDLLLNAGGYVEVAPARRGGKKLDTSRLSVYFGEEGHMRRAAAAKESEQETEAADSQG
ncbi:recombinase family protein [Streptomyces sp. R39]|uniref:Recombinase family protein n=1 Tax=Streptomyces sp. R39 TaxID=3238631 RepID=A0AB39QQ53_9ACTN